MNEYKITDKMHSWQKLTRYGFRTFRHCAADNLGAHLPCRHCFAAVSAFTDRYFKRGLPLWLLAEK